MQTYFQLAFKSSPVSLPGSTLHNPLLILLQKGPCHSPLKILFRIWIQCILSCWLTYAREAKTSTLIFTFSSSLFWLDLTFFSSFLVCLVGGPTNQYRVRKVDQRQSYCLLCTSTFQWWIYIMSQFIFCYCFQPDFCQCNSHLFLFLNKSLKVICTR